MKELKVVRYIKMDGKCMPWSDLTEKEQEELKEKLNQQGMKSLGYVPVKKETA
ncbi:hypothetical protein C8E03_11099 [Lachnotalea glycerini]|uniref:Uncharacterized protein n=1 Tax=Lachnotalea glycerini TaxID=1763509 RepID=A0A318ELE2_9FIRM|nr:hypothetical protein [Lachnotalea glycerini]PXV87338.1 hypothetical protein C8E03_11099 [Lachnotalea glycerini]